MGFITNSIRGNWRRGNRITFGLLHAMGLPFTYKSYPRWSIIRYYGINVWCTITGYNSSNPKQCPFTLSVTLPMTLFIIWNKQNRFLIHTKIVIKHSTRCNVQSVSIEYILYRLFAVQQYTKWFKDQLFKKMAKSNGEKKESVVPTPQSVGTPLPTQWRTDFNNNIEGRQL